MDFHSLILLLLMYWKMTDGRTKNTVSILFGGDVDYSRLTRYIHNVKNCSYPDSMVRLKKYFNSADYAMLNLETTVGEHKKKQSEINPNTVVGLFSDEGILPALKEVGVDIVTVANNHLQDFRESGVNDTIRLLKKHGLLYSGVVYGKDPFAKQEPLILKKNGLKIGILSYCDLHQCELNWKGRSAGPPQLRVANVIEEIRELKGKKGCDIIILFLHWGVEFGSVVNAGCIGIVKNLTKHVQIDLIVGSHPHVTQKHFYTKKTLVAASIGNLLFTPYGLANFNFNEPPANGHHSHNDFSKYEQIWYKQMQVMEDPTLHGRLLKIEFNKNGIVKEKSSYLGTQIYATEQHCVAVKKKDHDTWRPICVDDDPECTGTPTCNYIECDKDEPLPDKLPESPGLHA